MKIGVLGSCRVHTPAKIADSKESVSYVNDGSIGFVHNSADILQSVKILHDQVRPPLWLYSLLSIINTKIDATEGLFERKYAEVDCFVVELSSIRVIEYGGYSLQINRFKEHVRQIAVGPDGPPVLMGSKQWEGMLREASEKATSPEDINLLAHARLHEQSQAEIVGGIEQIVAALDRPILFVGHVNADKKGRAIAQRQAIVDAFGAARERASAEQVPWDFYDPTSDVLHYGYDRAMTDSAHYSKEFEAAYSEMLARRVKQFMSGVS